MKKMLSILLCNLILGTSLMGASAPASTQLAKALPVQNLNGKKAQIDFRSGSPILLVFFASWCGSCKKEAPGVVEVARKSGNRFAVVGVSVDKTADKAAGFVDKFNITYPVVIDSDLTLADAVGVKGTPSLVLVDGQGNILHKASKLDARMKELLGI
jgi:thiol-disulfide isomerase/thioredoxin